MGNAKPQLFWCNVFTWIDCRDLYEAGAMMLEDESIVIAGLLVGLNVIDCNMAIKDEDLDQPVSSVDFFLAIFVTYSNTLHA